MCYSLLQTCTAQTDLCSRGEQNMVSAQIDRYALVALTSPSDGSFPSIMPVLFRPPDPVQWWSNLDSTTNWPVLQASQGCEVSLTLPFDSQLLSGIFRPCHGPQL